MTVASLVEQHEAELTNLYVRPPMIAYKKNNAFGQTKRFEQEKKTPVRSYRELLLNNNVPYKHIYVTADAGMGKTSFAKMLAVKWCEAHNSTQNATVEKTSQLVYACENQVSRESEAKDKSERDSFLKRDSEICLSDTDTFSATEDDSLTFMDIDDDDKDILKEFEYLFLIKLREYLDKCMLGDMILEMMKSELKHRTCYTEEFLEKVLCSKQCLIIVDGLDEWMHPESCRRVEVIPHTRLWPECTVLTTTRPWKLSTAKLSKADIDRHVELSQLDETAARKLESHAVEFLNQRQNDQVAAYSKTKTVTGFVNSVSENVVRHIRYIPFVLLQMICLWFKNCPIGKSLCEVYSNIIEQTLIRWLVKTDSGHINCRCNSSGKCENIEIKCMKNNTHCHSYMPLLLKIGQLAFSTLFNIVEEKSLLFDTRKVLQYLTEEEIEHCLNTGLLSQARYTTFLSKLRMQLYFPHKTFHEFFCALFIATNWNDMDNGKMSIKQTISNKCISVPDILKMSRVFVFVCGLNPAVYSDISLHLATIVDMDQSVIGRRKHGVWYARCILEDYQRMQVSCFLESVRNGHDECKIVIEDIILGYEMAEDEQQALKKILSNNAIRVKSLSESGHFQSNAVQIPKLLRWSYLEALSIASLSGWLEPSVFQSIFTTAAHSLKYLEVERIDLTYECICAISRLNNLQGLNLQSVVVTTDGLNGISDCIGACMSLQQLRLYFFLKNRDTLPSGTNEVSINYLLRSIEAKFCLTILELNIPWQGHDTGHQSYVLDLSRHDKLQELVLEFRLAELHINSEHLVECEVGVMGEYSTYAVSSLLAELQGAPVLKTLTLKGIRNPPPRMDISAMPLLTKFTLAACDLGDRTVVLSPEMISLETIALKETTISIRSLRELFLSISKLPQPITVKLSSTEMTVREWRLLFDILGKLPKSIHVVMQRCGGTISGRVETHSK